jgi:putative membrane protein
VALGVSSAYELVEWGSALLLDSGATEFLGTQGDPWDTQSDMFCALLGASSTLLAFSRVHDRLLARTQSPLALTLDPDRESQR